MIAVNMLLFAFVTALVAVRWLPRSRWVFQAPLLGIAAWYAALSTVLTAIVVVGFGILLPSSSPAPIVCDVLLWCFHAMAGSPGLGVKVIAYAFAGAVLGALGTCLVRAARAGAVQRRGRRRHAEMLTLVGRPDRRLGGTVIDHPDPAAYVFPGRRCRLVVTSGALARLSDVQLAAVVAHEHAHVDGRHQVLLDTVRLLRLALPRMAVMTRVEQQIARLVELRADDVAARRHTRGDLADALVAMATRPGRGLVPQDVVAGTGGDALERLHRLLEPPRPLRGTTTAGIAVTVATIPLVPFVLVALCLLLPPLFACVTVG